MPAACIPHQAIRANPALTLWLTRRGGHLGFLGGSPGRPVYAAEDAALAFLSAIFERVGRSGFPAEPRRGGWDPLRVPDCRL